MYSYSCFVDGKDCQNLLSISDLLPRADITKSMANVARDIVMGAKII